MQRRREQRSSAPSTGLVRGARRPVPRSALIVVASAMLLVIAVGLACYANTLHAPFELDDEPAITQNPFIRHVDSLFSLRLLWRWSPFRFVTDLTFAANYALGALQVAGYHAVNIGIHVGAACLLLWLALLLQETPALRAAPAPAAVGPVPGGLALAAFAALLFVAHPVQTEAVTYIVQRAASLAALWYVLGLALYVRAALLRVSDPVRTRWRRAVLLSGCGGVFVLAMLTKENAATLPLAILLVELCFFPPADAAARGWRAVLSPRVMRLAGIFGVVVAAGAACLLLWLGPAAARGLLSARGALPGWDYFLTEFNVVRTYVRLLFLPIGQNLDYDYPMVHAWPTVPTLLSAALLLAVLLAAVRWFRRRPLAAFGILFFFLALAVESSFIPLPDVIFEHRLYLPSMGLALAVGDGAFALLGRLSAGGRAPWPGVVVMGLAVAGLAAATVARNALWTDPVALWADAAAKSPHKARVHHNLGLAEQGAKRLVEAAAEYRAALALDPGLVKSWNNLGNVEQRLGHLQEAEAAYRQALALDARFVHAYGNLGFLYIQMGRLDDAAVMLFAAARLQPSDAEVQRGLGKLASRRGKLQEAEAFYRRAAALNPDSFDIHNELGAVYFAEGRLDAAEAEYRAALRLNPSYAAARSNLGNVFFRRNDLPAAEAAYRAALRLDPRRAATYFDIGLVYQQERRWSAAAAAFRTALQIQPDHAKARAQLAYVTQHLRPAPTQ